MIVGVAIRKSVSYRGVQQPFSNIYHFDHVNPLIEGPESASLIREIVALEKSIHGTAVKFLDARVWSAGRTPAENELITVEFLSGNGALANSTGIDPERCVLLSFPAGRNVLGRAVYLRKWYHVCAPPYGSGTDWTLGNIKQYEEIAQDIRDTYKGRMDSLRGAGGVGPFFERPLCGPTGRKTTGSAIAYKWLEHHELGDEWR